MFDSGFKASRISTSVIRDEFPLIRRHLYKFATSKGRVYHVHIHEYEHKIFVVKYHLKLDEDSPDRYNKVINDFQASRVIKTVIDITLEILQKEEYASFAYIGIYKINAASYKLRREFEGTEGTQRFHIYKRLTEDFFGSNTFVHSIEQKINAYILINKKNGNPEVLLNEAITMFAKVFPDIDGLYH